MKVRDASVPASTYDTENARMLGYKAIMMWGCDDINQHTGPHESKDLGIWGYEDTSKHTRIWAYEDERMQG